MKAGGTFLAMIQTGCFSKFSVNNGAKRQQEGLPMSVTMKKPNVLFVLADQWRAKQFNSDRGILDFPENPEDVLKQS